MLFRVDGTKHHQHKFAGTKNEWQQLEQLSWIFFPFFLAINETQPFICTFDSTHRGHMNATSIGQCQSRKVLQSEPFHYDTIVSLNVFITYNDKFKQKPNRNCFSFFLISLRIQNIPIAGKNGSTIVQWRCFRLRLCVRLFTLAEYQLAKKETEMEIERERKSERSKRRGKESEK